MSSTRCEVLRAPLHASCTLDSKCTRSQSSLSSWILHDRSGSSRLCGESQEPAAAPKPPGLLPPQELRHANKPTVFLDVDGTLISSYAPRRAPRLPADVRTHFVGQGSKLNPEGIFVVERPGLQTFLAELSRFAEVVIFTAGLEDYARPIIDAIDPNNEYFSARIYREGTVSTPVYQCVKDLSRAGRDLARSVLVDDTPLAFLHQPNNGIPVLAFRGDPDDRLLLEVVLPLLQKITTAPDIRVLLQRRFDMSTWFRQHGYISKHAPCAVTSKAVRPTINITADSTAKNLVVPLKVVKPEKPKGTLLLMDFDKTFTNFDAGERLVEELAPELLPMLTSLQMPANFIPITNTVMRELQSRGVSRDKLLVTLQLLGAEVPLPVIQLLKSLNKSTVEVKLLSDCNSIFINHILTGAKLTNLVADVITNPACFERVEDAQTKGGVGFLGGHIKASSHRLVIRPWHRQSCGCPRCPENLCKGKEVDGVLHSAAYKKIVFCGDGANDICPALRLGKGDVVLARSGHALASHLSSLEAPPAAQVHYWRSHEELASFVRQHVE